MAPAIRIVNDAIEAVGVPFSEYTARELHVRDAMFILTCMAPTLGAGIVLLTRNGWWKSKARLSIQTVSAAWLVSVAAFGILVHYQRGTTTRATFILAVLHLQIEVLMNCVLLGLSALRSFAYTWTSGLCLLLAVLLLENMTSVFMTVAIIGGGIDALVGLLFLYGKQYWFALAAIGHLGSAIAVFAQAVCNIGVVPYNMIIFLTVWIHMGCTVLGISETHARHAKLEGALPSPLRGVIFSRRTLLRLSVIALVGSTGVTLYISYVLPV